ncbi:unnamed protein product [Heligmosomoides polygyrus]|uniref:GST N-terminal domain-containing protein n=1 Tax=Heligmosomoides polygyrus TaxID=6339 RepID=A0A183GTN3_HELPZ|nr:unnamed protein product [Heligmosomoides polygyrus]
MRRYFYYTLKHSYALHYFDVRGRGEAIRLMFAYYDVPFEDHRISHEDWPKFKAGEGIIFQLVADARWTEMMRSPYERSPEPHLVFAQRFFEDLKRRSESVLWYKSMKQVKHKRLSHQHHLTLKPEQEQSSPCTRNDHFFFVERPVRV